MKVIKFRIVPDIEEDIFRDIEIGSNHTFEELYRTIVNGFSFRGDQLASFYLSNEDWDKGHEIGLMDMGGQGNGIPSVMSEAVLGDIVKETGQKIILVYDFLKMWCFYIEVLSIEESDGDGSPQVVLAYGNAPDEDAKEMPDLMEGIDLGGGDSDDSNAYDDMMDDFDDSDFDSEDFDNIDDLDI